MWTRSRWPVVIYGVQIAFLKFRASALPTISFAVHLDNYHMEINNIAFVGGRQEPLIGSPVSLDSIIYIILVRDSTINRVQKRIYMTNGGKYAPQIRAIIKSTRFQ